MRSSDLADVLDRHSTIDRADVLGVVSELVDSGHLAPDTDVPALATFVAANLTASTATLRAARVVVDALNARRLTPA